MRKVLELTEEQATVLHDTLEAELDELREGGDEYPAHLVEALEVAVGQLEKEYVPPLFEVGEEDMAGVYAQAHCPECQQGVCDLERDDHDLSIYWNLPEGERQRLRARAMRAFDSSSLTEAQWNVLEAVCET